MNNANRSTRADCIFKARNTAKHMKGYIGGNLLWIICDSALFLIVSIIKYRILLILIIIIIEIIISTLITLFFFIVVPVTHPSLGQNITSESMRYI